MFLALSVFVFSLDQLLKAGMVRALSEIGSLPVIDGFFYLTLVFNRGAAFGLLRGRVLFLACFALLACGVLVWFMRASLRDGRKAQAAACACLLGGVCGNVADRLRIGAVVDFLDFDLGFYRWPAFNLADTAICLSVAVLCWQMLRADTNKKS